MCVFACCVVAPLLFVCVMRLFVVCVVCLLLCVFVVSVVCCRFVKCGLCVYLCVWFLCLRFVFGVCVVCVVRVVFFFVCGVRVACVDCARVLCPHVCLSVCSCCFWLFGCLIVCVLV